MRRLRSVLPVGSPRWAARLAHWRALGLGEDSLEKPKIAIVNSSSDLAVCYSHLDDVAKRLKAAVRAAGGVPFEIRTVAPSDFITSVGAQGGYILSARDLLAFDIEAMVEGALLDGMVCLASCDKTLPGHLIAAARLDLPTLILPCGYQSTGWCRGERVDLEEVFVRASHYVVDRDEQTLGWLTECAREAVAGPGVCSGLGTANTMHMVAEALGMTLFGTTPLRANSAKMWEAVDRAGARIVELVREDLRPSRILSPAAFRNAVTLLLAVGGSLNAVKHLQAVAEAGEIAVDIFATLEALYDQVPLLVEVRPNGTTSIEELEAAGGAAACLKELAPLLDPSVVTVEGETLGACLARTGARADASPIGSLAAPRRPRSTLMPVRGTLAPLGAFVRSTTWVQERAAEPFLGRAMIFEELDSLLAALREGRIGPGTAVVLRGMGPRGQPGMGMTSMAAFALARSELVANVALITDGQISGLVNQGLVVAEVTPEAVSADSPLGRIQEGDLISVDIAARRVDVLVDEALLRQRPPYQKTGVRSKGWLGVYAQLVKDVRRGTIVEA
ncbi:MAG TPA: dihydroxy-acid dehydratase [Chloroflexota bacterium]|jgi:dihydroxy-acid dehydratase|nr:dihydroxy-acid dehydratase [Chloroflexota bacterium]